MTVPRGTGFSRVILGNRAAGVPTQPAITSICGNPPDVYSFAALPVACTGPNGYRPQRGHIEPPHRRPLAGIRAAGNVRVSRHDDDWPSPGKPVNGHQSPRSRRKRPGVCLGKWRRGMSAAASYSRSCSRLPVRSGRRFRNEFFGIQRAWQGPQDERPTRSLFGGLRSG